MSRVAIVEPTSLLGTGLRERLEAEPDVELRLLASEAEAFGTLVEVHGEVSMVQPLSAEGFEGVDLALLCGSAGQQAEALAAVPQSVPTIQAVTDLERRDGILRVAGVNDDSSAPGAWISPHPAVVLLAHLLAALAPHRPRRLSGTVLLPASERGAEGLDELFEQTRSILNFSGDAPQRVFGRQLAFNLFSAGDPEQLGEQVRRVLGRELGISLHLLQGPVFHGIAAGLWIETAEGDAAIVEATLAASPYFAAAPAGGPAPIDAVTSQRILYAPTRDDAEGGGGVGLWLVMDNLGRGGAVNVVELFRQLEPVSPDA